MTTEGKLPLNLFTNEEFHAQWDSENNQIVLTPNNEEDEIEENNIRFDVQITVTQTPVPELSKDKHPNTSTKEKNMNQVSVEIYECDPDDLIRFGQQWAKMGQCIQKQVVSVLSNCESAECNPDAIRSAQDFISGFNEEIDTALDEWLENYNK